MIYVSIVVVPGQCSPLGGRGVGNGASSIHLSAGASSIGGFGNHDGGIGANTTDDHSNIDPNDECASDDQGDNGTVHCKM